MPNMVHFVRGYNMTREEFERAETELNAAIARRDAAAIELATARDAYLEALDEERKLVADYAG